MVIVNLPVGLIKFPFSYNEDVNGDTYQLTQLLLSGGRQLELHKVTTKEIQCMLKFALDKVSSKDFIVKLCIEKFD